MTSTQIIAKEGYKGAFILFILALIFWICDWSFLTFLFILVLFFWLFAFRNPERESQDKLNLTLLAPVDGTIVDIFTQENNICLNIDVGWLDAGILRAPMEIQSYKIDKKNGLLLRNISRRLKDVLNTQINFFSIKKYTFKMILYPEVFGCTNIYQKSVLSPGERMGFMKLGKLKLCFPASSIDLKIDIGDKVKSGETLLGYVK